MSVSFAYPWVLGGLVLAALVPLLAWRSRFGLSRGRTRLAAATRALTVAAVVVAVAEPAIGLPTTELAVAPVVDRSASVAASERSVLERRLGALRQRMPGVTVVDVAAAPPGPRTDLSGDVAVAAAILPRDRVRRVLLASDGRDHGGMLPQVVAAARRIGVHVDVLPLGEAPAADTAWVRRIDVPALVRAGETLDVGVELGAAREARATVELRLRGPRLAGDARGGRIRPAEDGGRVVATREVRLTRGTSVHRFEVAFPDDEGTVGLEARLRSPATTVAQNDRARALVRLTPRPRVLVVHELEGGARPALGDVFSAAGFSVETVRAPSLRLDREALERLALVVLDQVDLTHVTDAQQRALREWVELRGGGLVTITSSHAVRREPDTLREIEPIAPPPLIPEPRPLEVVLVIDRSSSMDGRPMASARQAAVSAVRALREDARVGVVAFSSHADRVLPLSGADRRAETVSFIGSLFASGGTDIGAALRAANGLLTDDPRYIHHVILLSDGESDPPPAIAAAQAIAERGATISVITLGYASPLMAQIARIGRGRYHVTQSVGSLPTLMVRESQFRQQPANRSVSFVPEVVTPSPLLEGVDLSHAPPLGGFALAEVKRGADEVLRGPDGFPILAHWHRGLGQVATFTSSTDGAWADGWRMWPGFHGFWTAIARAMLRPRTTDPVSVRVVADARRPDVRRVLVSAPTLAEEPAPVVAIARAPGDDGAPLALRPVAPGVFAGDVSLADGFVAVARMPWDPDPTAAAGEDRSYPEELGAFGPDREALAALAKLGGGRVLRSLEEAFAPPAAELVPRAVRTPLLAAALLLYLLSLLLLRWPEKRARGTATAGAGAEVTAARTRSSAAPRTSTREPLPVGDSPPPSRGGGASLNQRDAA
jgi:hypothetical protein